MHLKLAIRDRFPAVFNTLAISFALGLGLLTTPATHAAKTGDTFQDWKIQCETPKPEVGEICHAFQNLTMKEGNQRVLHIAVGFLPEKDNPVAIFTLPLGVALPPGVQLQVDEGEKSRFPIEVCTPDGCRAGLEVKPELMTALKAGSKAKITFANMQRQGLTVPVSLKGFTAAINSLK
ncbi:MAG: invasion associated locus B family protein [Gammaproteobacteria bacterium]